MGSSLWPPRLRLRVFVVIDDRARVVGKLAWNSEAILSDDAWSLVGWVSRPGSIASCQASACAKDDRCNCNAQRSMLCGVKLMVLWARVGP